MSLSQQWCSPSTWPGFDAGESVGIPWHQCRRIIEIGRTSPFIWICTVGNVSLCRFTLHGSQICGCVSTCPGPRLKWLTPVSHQKSNSLWPKNEWPQHTPNKKYCSLINIFNLVGPLVPPFFGSPHFFYYWEADICLAYLGSVPRFRDGWGSGSWFSQQPAASFTKISAKFQQEFVSPGAVRVSPRHPFPLPFGQGWKTFQSGRFLCGSQELKAMFRFWCFHQSWLADISLVEVWLSASALQCESCCGCNITI